MSRKSGPKLREISVPKSTYMSGTVYSDFSKGPPGTVLLNDQVIGQVPLSKHTVTEICSRVLVDQCDDGVLAGFLQDMAPSHLQNWQQATCFTRHGQTFPLAHFKQLHGTGNSSGSFGALIISGLNCSISSSTYPYSCGISNI